MNIDPVKALDDKVERLRKDIKALTEKLENAETDAAQDKLATTTQIRDTNRKLTKTNDRVTELAESVHRLERLLIALNRRARAGETQKADLDDWPEITKAEIAKILAGQEAYTRTTLTKDELKDSKAKAAKYDALVAKAIDAAEALTTLPANAEALWRTKYAEWRKLATAGARPEIPAEPTHEDAAAKAEGNEAVDQVRAKIRARIEDAVANDLLFPAWFENMLGPAAPPGRADDWVYTATDVVLYRLLHDVDSQADALGPAPQPMGHKRNLYERLVVECADYRK